MVYSYSISILFPFYFCKVFLSLPLNTSSSTTGKRPVFEISIISAVGILLLLCCNLIYMDISFDLLSACKRHNNCSSSYLGMIEACYCFSILLTTLFLKPTELAELFNSFNEIVNKPIHISDKSKIETLLRMLIFYICVLFQFLRNCIFEKESKSIMWTFKIIVQNVQYAIDGLIISMCLILVTSLKELCGSLNKREDRIRNIIIIFWNRGTLLRKLNICFGPLLVIVVTFKLLQILGLIYFYLLSNAEKNWLQSLEICLPTINFILICYSCDKVIIEANNFIKGLRLIVSEDNCSSLIKEEIETFVHINGFRTLCITGSNFFIVDMSLFFKICSVVFTYVVAIIQF